MNKIGIMCRASFGDCMFNTAAVRAIAEENNSKVSVFTQQQYQDAYANLDFIDLYTDQLKFANSCKLSYNFAPCDHFDAIKSHDKNFSLVMTHWKLAEDNSLIKDKHDLKPIFRPTQAEINKCASFSKSKPIIAVERAYFSQQSWFDNQAVKLILDKYSSTHEIIWCSNQDYPTDCEVNKLEGFTRRETILLLSQAEIFFTSGSGLFCASIGLQVRPRTVCLWKDSYYKYERLFAHQCWAVNWVHTHVELEGVL